MNTILTQLEHAAFTFAAVFFIAMGEAIKAGAVTPENLGWGVVAGVVVAAIQTAVRAIWFGGVAAVAAVRASSSSSTLEK